MERTIDSLAMTASDDVPQIGQTRNGSITDATRDKGVSPPWFGASYQHGDGTGGMPGVFGDDSPSAHRHERSLFQRNRLPAMTLLLGCCLAVWVVISLLDARQVGSAQARVARSANLVETTSSVNLWPAFSSPPRPDKNQALEVRVPSVVSSSTIIVTTEGHREAVLAVLYGLQEQLEGDIYFSSTHEEFVAASALWVVNATWEDDPPIAVIEVSNVRDVQRAMPVLAQLSKGPLQVPFRIRSGGHHKAGYSTVSGGVVLSLVRLNQFSIVTDAKDRDGQKSVAAIMGPSLRSGDVVEQAINKLGYGGVIGFCGSVAESGFALGGGFGIQSRLYGLGLDQILSVNIVLANGTLLSNVSAGLSSSPEKNDEMHHPDLFWALRGAGGGNFGVVTQLEYMLHPAHTDIVVVIVRFDDLDDLAYSMHRVGKYQADWPGNLCVMQDGFMELHFLWTGQNQSKVDEGLSFVYDQVLPAVLPPTAVQKNRTQIYDETFEWGDITASPAPKKSQAPPVREDGRGQNVPAWGQRVWRAKCWTGFLHPVNNTLPIWKQMIHTMNGGIQHINDELGKEILLPDIELWGGAMNHAAAWNETAFPHRSAIFNVGVLLIVPVEEKNPLELYEKVTLHVRSWWPDISQFLTGSYVNYPDIDLVENKAYLDVYYGANLPRLIDVKKRYDPENIFEFPMSIPTNLEEDST